MARARAFREADFARAVRAARKQGLEADRVEIGRDKVVLVLRRQGEKGLAAAPEPEQDDLARSLWDDCGP